MALSYMPRLDGLRAIAVIGVLVEHFIPTHAIRGLSTGGAGVTLFFVLSGYLITRILLDYRNENIGRAAANFYWRRLLRLSPPFYLAILVGVIANVMMMRETWWIHAFYLTNFQIGLTGQWTGGADHFWSLCTEEQFYLLWFFVVMWTPRRHFVAAIASAFVITFIFRSAVYFGDLSPLTTVLLPGNLASLAAGALLAEMQRSQNLKWLSGAAGSVKWFIATAITFAALSVSMRYVDWPRALFYPFAGSAFFGCLIYLSAQAGANRWLDWLAWRPLRHIGKISYGIFVYHLFLPPLFSKLPNMGWVGYSNWGSFLFLTLASICVAHLSWVFIESPVLRLKQRVPVLRERAENPRWSEEIARIHRGSATP
jgi:peptidoglycan/LPS O-acetylase OafA/YrhL